MNSTEIRYNELMTIDFWDNLSGELAASLVGELIDASNSLGSQKGLEHSITLCEQLRGRALPARIATILHYFEANAWSGLKPRFSGRTPAWNWLGKPIEQELFQLRLARQHAGFIELDAVHRCQILTNLANSLDTLGRCIEAIEIYGEALTLDPSYGMALGNRGICLDYLSHVLPHLPHEAGLCTTHAFLSAAHADLTKIQPTTVESGSDVYFEASRSRVENKLLGVDDASGVDDLNRSIGDSEAERNYRRWCLLHRLFLNFLNDLGTRPAAASDPLHLPSLVVPLGESPYCLSFFNQLKQEYATARFRLYEGIEQNTPHFSDGGVSLCNTLDYAACSMAVENVKIALRMSYSLFDKIGFLINHYLKLGIKPQKVNFRTLWYIKQDGKNGLRSEFETRENWSLRGLFWLSRDLYINNPEFQETLEPRSRHLAEIRNHAEHKYLRVHDESWVASERGDEFNEEPVYAVDRADIEARAIGMLKLARSALVYLACAIYTEERSRAEGRSSEEKIIPMEFGTTPDCLRR